MAQNRLNWEPSLTWRSALPLMMAKESETKIVLWYTVDSKCVKKRNSRNIFASKAKIYIFDNFPNEKNISMLKIVDFSLWCRYYLVQIELFFPFSEHCFVVKKLIWAYANENIVLLLWLTFLCRHTQHYTAIVLFGSKKLCLRYSLFHWKRSCNFLTTF